MFCVGVSLVNLGSKQKKKKENERDKEIKQCMRTISPSCDVFSFYLFIYFFLGGGVLSKHVLYKSVSLVA